MNIRLNLYLSYLIEYNHLILVFKVFNKSLVNMNAFIFQILLFLIFFSNSAFSQFDKVIVKMQSGTEVQLTDLPWFKLALNISHSEWKDRATTADWIIASPPPFCPYGNNFRLVWNGDINTFKKQTVEQCSITQRKKLNGLPKEVISLCDCKIVLETVSRVQNNRVIWQSLDDEILKSDEYKFRRTLVGPKGEIPVIFSVGSTNSGIYKFDGDKLCSFNGAASSDNFNASSAVDKINLLLKASGRPIPILCFEIMHGEIDISKVYFSMFRSKVLGDIYLNLNNGEKYVIEPY